MKRKVGTSLDETLYERVREVARLQGRSVNDLIEEGLRHVVGSRSTRVQVVRETWATYEVSRRTFEVALRADLYGPG